MTSSQGAQEIWHPRLHVGRFVRQGLLHAVLGANAILMIFPLLWMISTSLKAPSKQYLWPPQLIPNPLYPENYVNLFALAPMGKYMLNSTKITVLSMIGVILSSSLAAFAFARMRFRGRDVFFSILLATMMLPGAVTLVPTFVIMRLLGWVDTHAPLIIPSFFGSAFYVFLIRQYFLSIPQDFVDAAQIDGADFFTIYWRIFLPLSRPILTTVAVLTFLGSWNDLFGPLIYLNTQEKMTVQLGLAYLRGRAGTGVEQFGTIMAGAFLGLVPTLVLYFFGQKYFVQGLARSALKG
ncbi:MAG: carbohydrate ABC transporter permease [Chloroflexi bacterium]|nr:carbohydrate ABC transporter permease [Chloroflexota bacterium]